MKPALVVGKHRYFNALEDEVMGPDVILVLGPTPDTRPVSEPQATPFRLSLRHFQALSTPQTFDASQSGNLEATWSLRNLEGRVLRQYRYRVESGEAVFADGFESGDLCAWSSSVGGPSCGETEIESSNWYWIRDYAYRDAQLLAEIDGGERLHLHLDHLGSLRQVTDDAGEVVEDHDFLPFGEEVTGLTTESLLFTGHERDSHGVGSADDLDYMHARYCSPHLGRFLSLDPKVLQKATKKPQRWNRYTYSINNPLKFVDPDGRDIMLFVRNNSGGGWTNFGHVALRVHGNGHDKTFDFGRYGRVRGFLGHKGDGVLRVWKNFNAFQARQRASGDSKAVNFTTTRAQDQQALGFFQGKIDQGKQIPGNPNSSFTEFKLQQDYDLKANNCTTICVEAIESVQGLEAEADALSGQYDPQELYELFEEVLEENSDVEFIDFSTEPE